jgi:hypothetical protein
MSTKSETAWLVFSSGNHDALSVLLQNVRDSHHNDVVVVDQRNGQRGPHGGLYMRTLTSLGV